MPGSPSTAAHRLDARPSGPLLDFSEGRVPEQGAVIVAAVKASFCP
ncbi:hypothetical protein [Streptomyces sp. NPDC059816]